MYGGGSSMIVADLLVGVWGLFFGLPINIDRDAMILELFDKWEGFFERIVSDVGVETFLVCKENSMRICLGEVKYIADLGSNPS